MLAESDYVNVVNKGQIIANNSGNYKNYNPKMENISKELAKYIYLFLSGKSNNLPSAESIVNYAERINNDVISMGLGLIIYKDFSINYEDVINDRNETRSDDIKYDSYTAVRQYCPYHKKTVLKEAIDVDKDPCFDMARIQKLQELLRECVELSNQKTR